MLNRAVVPKRYGVRSPLEPNLEVGVVDMLEQELQDRIALFAGKTFNSGRIGRIDEYAFFSAHRMRSNDRMGRHRISLVIILEQSMIDGIGIMNRLQPLKIGLHAI